MRFVYILSLGAWVGMIGFFSFIVTRAARRLEPKQTSKFLRGLFPEYYLVQIVCGGLSFLCALGLLADQQFRSQFWGMLAVILLAVITGTLVWIRLGVLPRIAKLGDRIAVFKEEGHEPDKSLAAEWKQLHAFTVFTNLAALVIGFILLAGGLAVLQ